jgi:hypothetical protein
MDIVTAATDMNELNGLIQELWKSTGQNYGNEVRRSMPGRGTSLNVIEVIHRSTQHDMTWHGSVSPGD